MRGIDVSHYQGVPSWDRVAAAGVDFAICKATQGISFVDDSFHYNWRNIKAAGLPRGAYHFLDENSGGFTQADHFIATVKQEGGWGPGSFPPIVDWEQGTRVQVTDCINRIRQLTGITPILYSGHWLREHGGGKPGNVELLWLAAYVDDYHPYIPTGWKASELFAWQYGGRQVDGIDGNVDADVLLYKDGSRSALLEIAGLPQEDSDDMAYSDFKAGVRSRKAGEKLADGSDPDFIFGWNLEDRVEKPAPPLAPHVHDFSGTTGDPTP